MQDALENIVLGQRDLKELLARKRLVDCSGSKIPSQTRQKHFQTYKCPLLTLFTNLPVASAPITAGLLTCAQTMLLHRTSGHQGEVQYIQPPTKLLVECLADRLQGCHAEQELSYRYRVEDDEDIVNVDGKMDHAVRYMTAVLVTVEDKKLDMNLADPELGQARSQIASAADDLFSGYSVRPAELWGILHNGPIWCFIRRFLTPTGRVQWNHAFAPPLFSNNEVLGDNINTVARCLEHICQNAEGVIAAINCCGRLSSVAEDSQSSEGGSDSGGEDGENGDEELANIQEFPPTPPPNNGMGRAAGQGRGHGHGHGHRGKGKKHGATVSGKDSCGVCYNFMPLTVANVSRIASL